VTELSSESFSQAPQYAPDGKKLVYMSGQDADIFPGEIQGGMFQMGGGVNGAAKVAIGGNLPDGSVLLGIRPEDIVASEEPSTSARFFATASVDVVEHMGHETMAHFALGGVQHIARLSADEKVRTGDRLPLAVRAGAEHVFSTTDGSRLN